MGSNRISWEQVISWRLRRGHLAKRRAAAQLEDVVRAICGAHAQIMSTVPLALSARLSRLSRGQIDRAIAEERTLVKTWAMRGTLHVFAADDVPLYCAAQGTRDQYTNPSFLRAYGLERADIDAVLEAIPQALDGRALTRGELTDQILEITKRPHLEERLRSGWGELLKPAAFKGKLCFGPQDGQTVSFVRPDQWLGSWQDHDTDEALVEVFRRFLAVYGPADRSEIARWWGVRPPEAGRVLRLMPDELAEVHLEDGSKKWILEKDLRSLRGSKPVTGVRLLPSFDQLLVMCAPHKEAIVDPRYADRIYRPRIAVWSLPAVLVDGRIRAAWKLDRKRKRATLTVAPFERMSSETRGQIEAEVCALGKLLGADIEPIVEKP
jgi:hypothetical protein